jgi:hypothetical protein
MAEMEQGVVANAGTTLAENSRRHSAKAKLASSQDISSTLVSGASPLPRDRRFSTLTESYSNARRIQPITHDDYNNAPRIVQMQVSLAEVEAATRLMNEALDHGIVTWQFSETRAKLVLKPLGFSQRKCKMVLMSLCHFQRLIMRRLSQVGASIASADQLGLLFEVV